MSTPNPKPNSSPLMNNTGEVFMEPVTDFEQEKMEEMKRLRKELNSSPDSQGLKTSPLYPIPDSVPLMDSAGEVFEEPITHFKQEKITRMRSLSPPKSPSSSSSDYITESEEEIEDEAYISRNDVILICSSDDDSLEDDNFSFCEKCYTAAPNISLRSSVSSNLTSAEDKKISITIAYKDNSLKVEEIHEVTGKCDGERPLSTLITDQEIDNDRISYTYCTNDLHNSASNYNSTLDSTDMEEEGESSLEHSRNNVEGSLYSENLTEFTDNNSVYIVNCKHIKETSSVDNIVENNTLYSIKNNIEIIQAEDLDEESESENNDSSSVCFINCSIRSCEDRSVSYNKMFEHKNKIKIIKNSSSVEVDEDNTINSSSSDHNTSTSPKINSKDEAKITEKFNSLKINKVDEGNSTEATEEPINRLDSSNVSLTDRDIFCSFETFDTEDYSNQNMEEKHSYFSGQSETLNSLFGLKSTEQNNKDIGQKEKYIINPSSNKGEIVKERASNLEEKSNVNMKLDLQLPTCQHNNTSSDSVFSKMIFTPMRIAVNDQNDDKVLHERNSLKQESVNNKPETDLGFFDSFISSKSSTSKEDIHLEGHNHLENDKNNKTAFVSGSVEHISTSHFEEDNKKKRNKLNTTKKNEGYKSDKSKVENDSINHEKTTTRSNILQENPDKENVCINQFEAQRSSSMSSFPICNALIIDKPIEGAKGKQTEMEVCTLMNKSASNLVNHEKTNFLTTGNASPRSSAIKKNSSKISIKSEESKLVSAIQTYTNKADTSQSLDIMESQVANNLTSSSCNSSVSKKTHSVSSASCPSMPSTDPSISASSDINSNKINTGECFIKYDKHITQENNSLILNGINDSKSTGAIKRNANKISVESKQSKFVSAVQNQASKFEPIQTLYINKSRAIKGLSNSLRNSPVSGKTYSVSSKSCSSRPSFQSSTSLSSDISSNKIFTGEHIECDKSTFSSNDKDSKNKAANKKSSSKKRVKSKPSELVSAVRSQTSFHSINTDTDNKSDYMGLQTADLSKSQISNRISNSQCISPLSKKTSSVSSANSSSKLSFESSISASSDFKSIKNPNEGNTKECIKYDKHITHGVSDSESSGVKKRNSKNKNHQKSNQFSLPSAFESRESSFESTSATVDKESEDQSPAETENKNHQNSKESSFTSAFESQESSLKGTNTTVDKEYEHQSPAEIISHSKTLDASLYNTALIKDCNLHLSCTVAPIVEPSTYLSTIETTKNISKETENKTEECISLGLNEHVSCIKKEDSAIHANINNLVNPATTSQNKSIGLDDYNINVGSEEEMHSVARDRILGRVSQESNSEFLSAVESQESSFYSACTSTKKESDFTGAEYQLFGGLSVSDYFARVMTLPHTSVEEPTDISYSNLECGGNNLRNAAAVDLSIITDEAFDKRTNISVLNESFAKSIGINSAANFPAFKSSWKRFTENPLQPTINPLIRPTKFNSNPALMLAQTNLNKNVKSTSKAPNKEKLCQEIRSPNLKTPANTKFNLLTPNSITTKRTNTPLSAKRKFLTPRSETRINNQAFFSPGSGTEIPSSSQKRRDLLSEDKRFCNIKSPIRTYIQNPSPVLVTQVKGTQKELRKSTPKKIGSSSEKKKYESSNREKRVVQQLNYDINEGETRENKDPNYNRPSLLPVCYRSAPNVFLKDSRNGQKKLPKLNDKFKKMLDTPRPRVIKHEGRAFAPPPEPGSLLSNPQLAMRPSNTVDAELLPQDIVGDISICATKTLFKSNTLSK